MDVLWFSLFLIWAAEARQIPPTWKTCKSSDPAKNDCLRDAVSFALKDLMNGKPSLGVRRLDPLSFTELSISQGGPSVGFHLLLTEVQVLGLKSLVVDHVETDWKMLKALVHPAMDLTLTGHYKINGNFMLQPITGEGQAEFTIEDSTANATIKFAESNVNGMTYNRIDDSNLQINLKRLRVKLENLFNGDKTLGETMNKLMNDNWQALWAMMKVPVETAYLRVLDDVGSAIFGKIPKSELAPN